MTVDNVKIENFRNLQKTDFSPDKKMNVICGPNAQGKTNLLEALWLFTGAKSFRGAKENELVTFGKEKASLSLSFSAAGLENSAKINLGEKKQFYFNDNLLHSSGMMAGNFCAIIFSPNDIALVKDGPAIRRRFLDTAIYQIYPKYAAVFRRYTRAVQQRNAAIRDLYYHSELTPMIDAFDSEIAQSGAEVVEYRRKYTDMLKSAVPKIYSGISDKKETLSISYVCNCSSEYLFERLRQSRKEDMRTGVTGVGPHRDDVEFTINGISARLYGSQGQKRSVALSLKLAEAEILKNKTGEETVALLDDVMSELDPTRQNYVLNHIKNWQVFITCCDPTNIENLSTGRVFTMKNGRLEG